MKEALSLAAKAGHILLENGAELSRVEETMRKIVRHYGEDDASIFLLSNGIFVSGESYANIDYIPIKGARLDRVVEVNQLSRDIEKGKYTLEEAGKELKKISKMPPKPLWEQFLGAAVGSAGFCIIFGGGMSDCAVSTIAGLLLYVFAVFVGNRYMSKMLCNIFAAMIGAFCCIGLSALGFGNSLGNMIIGAMIPLIPGVPFTNGLRDIANEDYIAGATRLLDALMVFFCIALGVCLTFITDSLITGSMIQLHGMLVDSFTAQIWIQMIAAFLSTVAFAILFGVPRRFYLSGGVVGTAGWLVYLLISRYTVLGITGGAFFATVVLALISRKFAELFKCPGTIFLICGIFPLIPGAGVFWCSYYMVSEQFNLVLNSGFTAIKVMIAIVLGIIITTNLIHGNRMSRRLSKQKIH